jgi:hypothetical protein
MHAPERPGVGPAPSDGRLDLPSADRFQLAPTVSLLTAPGIMALIRTIRCDGRTALESIRKQTRIGKYDPMAVEKLEELVNAIDA